MRAGWPAGREKLMKAIEEDAAALALADPAAQKRPE
jgi:hypothetical protein